MRAVRSPDAPKMMSDARLGRAPEPQALEQRVRLVTADGAISADRVLAFASSTACIAWPPNWLRSAAFTLAANDSSWREAKRAKSAAVMTGAGTFSSIASAIVQRPSPESST